MVGAPVRLGCGGGNERPRGQRSCYCARGSFVSWCGLTRPDDREGDLGLRGLVFLSALSPLLFGLLNGLNEKLARVTNLPSLP